MSESVRVRFAPSPTGFLHVGGLRTALYNYLFARQRGGAFILRIEDTDRSRYVPGAVEMIVDSLRWAGLDYDEGPDVGGPYGPYFQSQRLDRYREAAEDLLARGRAYPCFCTPERLESMRKEREKDGGSTKYDRACLRIDREVARARREAGETHVIRLRVPDERAVSVRDLIRGHVEFSGDVLDDQVLLKSDGFPTYHLANVVDDHQMEITHVIRGEEWLPSTPKHVLLYRFLDWQPPRFAHLPLLLGRDRSKLSKRQADVAVSDYRERGFDPAALVNFVALLGWNPGSDREVFSLEELVREFSLERVGKSGAIFSLEKLQWLNQEHVRARPVAALAAEVRPLLAERGLAATDESFLRAAIETVRDRMAFPRDVVDRYGWFFEDPSGYDEEVVAKRWTAESGPRLLRLTPLLETLPSFDTAALEDAVRSFVAAEGIAMSDVVHPLRLACTGVGVGPGLYALMSVLGRETCVRRLRSAARRLA